MTNPDEIQCEYHTCNLLASTYTSWPDNYSCYLCVDHLHGFLEYLTRMDIAPDNHTTVYSNAFIQVLTDLQLPTDFKELS